ncbi:hypothetical protein THII_0576 [Thioploca ingrica]|uniref:Uncharacterized protein n=1 Tax=Thioploca ingrica TaxID=40754 RepID=A0A090ABC5_9GAMM|nr:hypothetical protein THII_0576 [Thioploca ingrica]
MHLSWFQSLLYWISLKSQSSTGSILFQAVKFQSLLYWISLKSKIDFSKTAKGYVQVSILVVLDIAQEQKTGEVYSDYPTIVSILVVLDIAQEPQYNKNGRSYLDTFQSLLYWISLKSISKNWQINFHVTFQSLLYWISLKSYRL